MHQLRTRIIYALYSTTSFPMTLSDLAKCPTTWKTERRAAYLRQLSFFSVDVLIYVCYVQINITYWRHDVTDTFITCHHGACATHAQSVSHVYADASCLHLSAQMWQRSRDRCATRLTLTLTYHSWSKYSRSTIFGWSLYLELKLNF